MGRRTLRQQGASGPFATVVLHHGLTDLTVRAIPVDNHRVAVCGIDLMRRTHEHLARLNADQRRHLECILEALRAFLDGRRRNLGALPLALADLTPFRQAVLTAARSIPWGHTLSYEQLAASAGRPGATRAAASVMRTNPVPLVIPCHRVVRKDGSLGGFMGRGDGPCVDLKARLLRREGWRG